MLAWSGKTWRIPGNSWYESTFSNPPSDRVILVVTLFVIRTVFGSKLGRVIGYPEWGLAWYSSVPSGKWRGSTSIGPRPVPFKSFPIHQSFYRPTLCWQYMRRPYNNGSATTGTTQLRHKGRSVLPPSVAESSVSKFPTEFGKKKSEFLGILEISRNHNLFRTFHQLHFRVFI
jgi:hypothetical protein